MEKLIELLNEYGKVIGKSEYYEWEKSVGGPFCLFVRDLYDEHHIYSETADTYVISKKFGFIKWLVENDKIDFEGMSGHGKIISYLTDEKDYKWNDIKEGVVLMLLSISENPIEFLISILK